jgi:hypothetical protein
MVRRSYYVGVFRHDRVLDDTGVPSWVEEEIEQKEDAETGKERADELNTRYRTGTRFYSARMVWLCSQQ